MLILLSPAKKQDFQSSNVSNDITEPLFLDESRYLVSILRELPVVGIKSLMSLSDSLAEMNFDRFSKFSMENNCKAAAAYVFNGDVYAHLNAQSLTANDMKFYQQNFLILSGLYGVLRPLDEIEAHRLEMGTKLANKMGKDLYSFWKDKITSFINHNYNKCEFILNLASIEYFSAIDKKKINFPVVNVYFQELRNGKLKTIALNSKRARGAMSRYIIQNEITSIKCVKDFNGLGYIFDEKLSSSNELFFVK